MKHLAFWLRYVDDTDTTVHQDEIDEFHEHLNKKNASIQFTMEIDKNGKIPFLDCLVPRDDNTLRPSVYRTLTDYSTKLLAIPLHTKRLQYEL